MYRWLWVLYLAMALTLVGYAAETDTKKPVLDGSTVSTQETSLGNVMTDALRHATGADIAIMHAMAFTEKAQLDLNAPADDHAIRDTLSLPTDKIAVLSMPPAILRKVMERAVSRLPGTNVAFLQVSGLEVTYDPAKPKYERVKEIKIGGKTINLTDRTTLYKVAMPAVLAKGAVGYILEFSDMVMRSMQMSDTTLLDAVKQELTKAPLNVPTDARLIPVPPAKAAPHTKPA